jgi:hypothetical protein
MNSAQKKLGAPKPTVQHNAQIGKYLISTKRHDFDPLLTLLMQQASKM